MLNIVGLFHAKVSFTIMSPIINGRKYIFIIIQKR